MVYRGAGLLGAFSVVVSVAFGLLAGALDGVESLIEASKACYISYLVSLHFRGVITPDL